MLSSVAGCGSGGRDRTEGTDDAPRHVTPLTFSHLLPFFSCARSAVRPDSVSSLRCVLIAGSLAFQQSLGLEAQLSVAVS